MVVADVLICGQILNVDEIGNFPGFPDSISGADFGALVEQQATEAGAEFVFDQAQSITSGGSLFTVSGSAGDLSAPAVIVATGSTLRRLGMPGEDRLEGRGVSYCGSCDAAMFAGRRVAVIGGGDSAADEALVVAEHASEVVMVLREPELHAAAATLWVDGKPLGLLEGQALYCSAAPLEQGRGIFLDNQLGRPLEVEVRDSLEKAMKILKQKMSKEGILQEVKRRVHFVVAEVYPHKDEV